MSRFISWPMVLGHENVADVVDVGDSVSGYSIGQRVVVDPTLSCVPRGIEPTCQRCAEGRFGICENFAEGDLPEGVSIGYNSATGGSWGEYFVAHESQLIKLDDDVSDETAVMIDPAACALHGVLRAAPKQSESVLVLGGGVVGLCAIASLRALAVNASITAVVRHGFQAKQAEDLGANRVITIPRGSQKAERYAAIGQEGSARTYKGLFGMRMMMGGFDIVCECLGGGENVSDALKFARGGGTVVSLGSAQIHLIDWTPVWFSELTVLGGYGRGIDEWDGERKHTYKIAIDLIRQGRLPVERLLTHRFRIHQYRQAMVAIQTRARSGLTKTAFDFR
jgi:threonine dehydrogenase-like Zn-dependent dehydrogenase